MSAADKEHERKLAQESRWAALCLGMVSVHVTLAKGVRFHCYVMPWECMSRALQFLEAGAVNLSLHYTGSACFTWHRESSRRRKAA